MARRRLDPGLIALAGSLGLPHRAAATPVPEVAPTAPVPSLPPSAAKPAKERARTPRPAAVAVGQHPPPPAPVSRGGVRPTDEQAAIVAAARDLRPGDALRIVAFAGAGKTTTLKMVAREAGLGRGL